MPSLQDNHLVEVMSFIIDSVAVETKATSRAEIGIYLMSLVLTEYQNDATQEIVNSPPQMTLSQDNSA
ncbi:hypothetical protein DC365_17445 [Vibrio vulnificus]|uniref:Uncharacterized protein n=2 Tax=Vibrio TaxID=662 RepID=A0AA47JMI8_VIBPH|nr:MULTISPECIES: hypothetical protein [Vibrio]ELY5143030.1 hypothetical protein [Vibrio vulnificus]MBE3699156.1 hypothetical protein [Vibrio parahaemolyticus]MBE3748746.1 hypothetical protein [Vibrio parahaemolyticus]MBE3779039.1 hypothetical protein [Vibrio parahaemolyticus]MBE4418134.1 hypothetical protein [Vibrio parahaemolyticus]